MSGSPKLPTTRMRLELIVFPQLSASALSGGLQVGNVQKGKDVVRERAGKLGEKRLIDLAAEIDRLGS